MAIIKKFMEQSNKLFFNKNFNKEKEIIKVYNETIKD